MNARSNRTRRWPYRDSSIDGEDNVAMNQRMVGQLLRRKTAASNMPAWQSRSLTGLGIEVSQSREENSGLSLKEAAKRGGLDPAFLALVEAGKALPDEITRDVLKSLSKGVKAKSKNLESAMAIQHSSILGRDSAGQIMAILVSLCAPPFLNQATAFKNHPHESHTSADVLLDNDSAQTGYRIESLSPPALSFFTFNNAAEPLRAWSVSVRCGLEEIASGVTDDEGVFRFPPAYKGFPENTHMLINRGL